MEIARLKVDATALATDDNRFVLIYNINIPRDKIRDRDSLNTVCYSAERDYAGTPFSYDITGCYVLVNNKTGEEKLWAGSFFPSGNLTSGDGTYTPYSRNKLLHDLSNIDRRINEWRNFGGRETDWVYDRLMSVIVTCNGKVRPSLPFLTNHNLIAFNRRRQQRRIAKFDLS